VASVVRAFRIAREVTRAEAEWDPVEQLSGADRAAQAELMTGIDRLVEAITRWYTAWPPDGPLEAIVDSERAGFERYVAILPELLDDDQRRVEAEIVRRLAEAGVPEAIAAAHARRGELIHAPDVIRAAAVTGRSIEDAARVFAGMGAALRLDWMERELDRVRSTTRMQRWALQAVREDAFHARRKVTQQALLAADGLTPAQAVERFVEDRAELARRLDSLMRAVAREGDPDLAGLTLAVRGLRGLAA
jgi:glutamate dehydrogenase